MKLALNEGTLQCVNTYSEKIALVASSDITNIGLWVSKLQEHQTQYGESLEKLRAELRANSLHVVELNFVQNLFTASFDSEALHEEICNICSLATYFSCPLVTAATFGELIEHPKAVQKLTYFADYAAQFGQRIAVEFLPWTGVKTLKKAWKLVTDCKRENVGILLDTFHFFESESSFFDLETIPIDFIFHIHVSDYPDPCCDLTANSQLSIIDRTRNFRCMPGMGKYDLRRFFDILKTRDYSGYASLEVLSKTTTPGNIWNLIQVGREFMHQYT